jgi:tripartite-type tricarboxylate transporter receptor subunit TctC
MRYPATRRRTWLFASLCAGAALLGAGAAGAQEFPSRPVRIIAPFSAGGGADLAARRLAERLNNRWKQPIVVQNIAGAAGNTAAHAVATSEPDGYTLFFASLPILVTNPLLYAQLPFNAERDFAPVILVSDTPHILLVSAGFRAGRLSELIAYAKAQPGKVNFGSGGQGTSLHLAGELLKTIAGIDMVHIPYKGVAPAIAALLGDEIQTLFDSGASALGHIRGGRARGLAIASRTRAAVLPEVPTFDEGGIANFYSGVPHGVLVPAGTPPKIIAAINRTINAVFQEPDYRKAVTQAGINIAGGEPSQLTVYLAGEKKKWQPLIQSQGIKAF